MKLHFPFLEPPRGVSIEDWENPNWQNRQALKAIEDFDAYFDLSSEERKGFEGLGQLFQVRVTPYYAQMAALLKRDNPIRRILMPHGQELVKGEQQQLDPLGERKHSPVKRIIHRYPDRVLFLVTDFCSVYCRYCTRKHFTGQDQVFPKKSEYLEGLEYIKNNSHIREVILSGGDPLTLSDTQVQRVLNDLRNIDHVEIIRIGSRMPVVNPYRITKKLCQVLQDHSPVYLMNHFNHPKEITLQSKQALDLLANHGIPMMNQMVLLNGVNNHPAIVQALSRRLLYLRVKPYYMFQCDPSIGTDHLRIPVEHSINIQKQLFGSLSGLAMPTLSLDIPSGGGKSYFAPSYLTEQTDNTWKFKGWDGIEAEYVDPVESQVISPNDVADYEQEWDHIKNGPYGSC